jgi:hypothetical protein
VIGKLPSNFCAAFELWSSSFNPHSSFLALHMKGLFQLYASLNLRSSKQNEYAGLGFTAKIMLERLGIKTSSSFVKI